ncbi:MAG: hypothetical protein ACREQA_01945 [Candidatus Binatia bacterium]
MEKLPPARRKPIVQVIDAFLRGEKAEKGGWQRSGQREIVRLNENAAADFRELSSFS